MTIPATTGVLRNKITDMEIGDYITCYYTASTSGQYGFFTTLGLKLSDLTRNANYTESPYTGVITSSPMYQAFYFIKTAKGLLISDRVVQNSISWDQLNTKKVIQGLPWDTGNIIPTMTSNTSPSGVASASSEYAAGREAYQVFDNNTVSWSTAAGETTGWISYTFDSPKTIKKYSVTSVADNVSYPSAPKDWTFEGWNETQWVVLDTRTNQTFANSEKKAYMVDTPNTFSKYRLNVSSNGGYDRLAITRIEMFETVGIIRSLTGGVAYADANGNKSLSDLGFGGWPTNNEYDKYIANWPTDKIQVGKTLDDVFHWSGTQTWTQDTRSAELVSGSNYMTSRGKANLRHFDFWASSASITNVGFRPVFVFKES